MELSFNKPYEVLSANKLKLIALISMTIDHIGLLFFPYTIIFRILGRFAFPIFAYFIAVGCYYTHNKLKHFLHLFWSMGIIKNHWDVKSLNEGNILEVDI